MTTQIPYEPRPAPPLPSYPTAPPWAPPVAPDVAAPPGPAWAGQPHTRHGQLMVRYPELMHGAGRPDPPSWLPVAVVSLVLSVVGVAGATVLANLFLGVLSGVLLGVAGGALGLLGGIEAARRAGRAGRAGHRRYPYWLAFVLALVAAAVPGLLALNVTERIMLRQMVEPLVVTSMQDDMVHGGRVRTAPGVTVRSAQCTPTAARRPDGLRAYRCDLRLSTGASGVLLAVADLRGGWTAVRAN